MAVPTMPRLFRSAGLVLLLCFAAVSPAALFALDRPQFHALAGGELPTAFGTIDGSMKQALDAKLFTGTYGTQGYGLDIHILFPLAAPFYVGGNLGYKAGIVHDYFLDASTRYMWMFEADGSFGIILRPWPFLQAYAGGTVGIVTLRTGGPLSPASYMGPAAGIELGADFLFFGYLAAGPRVQFLLAPMVGQGGAASSYGYVSIALQIGYSH